MTKTKKLKMKMLMLVGLYFLVFHAEPFPFNHNDIGLPPYHVVHGIFGAVLLIMAVHIGKKDMK